MVGAGYWGPNLVRNFLSHAERGPALGVRPRRRPGPQGRRAATRTVQVTDRLDEVLADPTVDAVAIATPAAHARARSALAALEAGKHVLVEKPLADHASPTGASWSRRPSERGLVADVRPHLLLHAGRAAASASWCAPATLGEIQFVDSVRINLGLVQPDVDVFWDLAPHDLSILDFVLPGGAAPGGGRRARRRPDRRRRSLRRLPDAAAGRRRDRARARQLAEPDQDPHDDHRRLQADAGLGRPEPAAAAAASTTAASTWPAPDDDADGPPADR